MKCVWTSDFILALTRFVIDCLFCRVSVPAALLAAFFLLACPDLVHAASRVALVIANGRYKDVPLSNPEIDASLVADSLRDIGFDVEVVRDADLKVFDETLRAFSSKAAGADIALVYFAGHGFALEDGLRAQNYLMSTSAEITSPSDRVIRAGGIPLDEVVQSVASRATVSLVFIDACRRSPRDVRGVGGRGRGFARLPALVSMNVFVGMSTRLEDTADDGLPGEGSPFARAFAKAIKVPGVRIDDTFAEIRKIVSLETRGGQRPEAIQTDLDAPVILRPNSEGPAPAPLLQQPSLEEAASIWNHVKDSNSEQILREFRARFTGTLYAALADSRLAEIKALREEQIAWAAVELTKDTKRLRDFLERFPNGSFAAEARTRLVSLEPPPRVPRPPSVSLAPRAKPLPERVRLPKPAVKPKLVGGQGTTDGRRRGHRSGPRVAGPSRSARPSGSLGCFSFGGQRFCE